MTLILISLLLWASNVSDAENALFISVLVHLGIVGLLFWRGHVLERRNLSKTNVTDTSGA